MPRSWIGLFVWGAFATVVAGLPDWDILLALRIAPPRVSPWRVRDRWVPRDGTGTGIAAIRDHPVMAQWPKT